MNTRRNLPILGDILWIDLLIYVILSIDANNALSKGHSPRTCAEYCGPHYCSNSRRWRTCPSSSWTLRGSSLGREPNSRRRNRSETRNSWANSLAAGPAAPTNLKGRFCPFSDGRSEFLAVSTPILAFLNHSLIFWRLSTSTTFFRCTFRNL